MAKYTPAPDIKSACEKLVRKYPSQFPCVATDRVHFWWDESLKERRKYAYVRKIDDLSKHLDPDHDFHFVVSRFMIKDFAPGQRHALLCHELMHIGPRDVDAEGKETVKIARHDFEEFYAIVGAFGIDWTFNRKCPDPLVDDVAFSYMPVREAEKEPALRKAAKSSP